MNILAVLRRHARPIQGGPPSPLDIDALRKDLAIVRRENRSSFVISASMLGALFLAALAAFLFVENRTLRAGAYALGLIVASVVAFQMRALWKDKVMTDMLTVLASACREDLLQTIVTTLLADAMARKGGRPTGTIGDDWIGEVHEAALAVGLEKVRDALLSGVSTELVAQIPLNERPDAQLLLDLHALRRGGTLVDGSVPLAAWLANAVRMSRGRRESNVFVAALSKTGGPRPDR